MEMRHTRPAPPRRRIVPWIERAVQVGLIAKGVRSRRARLKQGEVHFYDAPGGGDLPTVVCLHGIGASAMAFGRLLNRLRPRVRRVLIPEMLGHGLSGAPAGPLTPDLIDQAWQTLLRRELTEPALVVGNSLGGGMALRFALAHPDLVRGVVVSSPAGAWLEQEELAALLAQFRLKSPAEAAALMLRVYHRPPLLGRLVAADVHRFFSTPTTLELLDAIRPEDQIAPEALARLQMPLLVLWGRSDRLMPAKSLEYFRQHLPPHARIEELEEVGHSPHVECPDDVAKRILDFAEGLPL